MLLVVVILCTYYVPGNVMQIITNIIALDPYKTPQIEIILI